MKKKLILVVLTFVGLVLVGLVGLVAGLDALLKRGVENVGSKVTQVAVKLDGVSLSLLRGRAEIRGLEIGNPPGYQSEAAMKLGAFSLSLVPKSIFSDRIHVKSVAIVAPEITLEVELKHNNLTEILANVQENSGPAATNQTDQADRPKKLQVDSLVIRGATVTARLDLLGGQPLSYTLPDIQVSHLGQGPEGITGAELSQRILDLVFNRALTVGVGPQQAVGSR